jgi:hypothetical protein
MRTYDIVSREESSIEDPIDDMLTTVENQIFSFGKEIENIGISINTNTDSINMLMKYIMNS